MYEVLIDKPSSPEKNLNHMSPVSQFYLILFLILFIIVANAVSFMFMSEFFRRLVI